MLSATHARVRAGGVSALRRAQHGRGRQPVRAASGQRRRVGLPGEVWPRQPGDRADSRERRGDRGVDRRAPRLPRRRVLRGAGRGGYRVTGHRLASTDRAPRRHDPGGSRASPAAIHARERGRPATVLHTKHRELRGLREGRELTLARRKALCRNGFSRSCEGREGFARVYACEKGEWGRPAPRRSENKDSHTLRGKPSLPSQISANELIYLTNNPRNFSSKPSQTIANPRSPSKQPRPP